MRGTLHDFQLQHNGSSSQQVDLGTGGNHTRGRGFGSFCESKWFGRGVVGGYGLFPSDQSIAPGTCYCSLQWWMGSHQHIPLSILSFPSTHYFSYCCCHLMMIFSFWPWMIVLMTLFCFWWCCLWKFKFWRGRC